jgi:TPP-dependent pyruvate/acetoin dehydrogenase alpha subunit
VKRYPAFDPPEYVDWSPDPDVMEEYRSKIEHDPLRRPYIEELTAGRLLDLYAGMVRFRLHDIALKRWVRQGVISKAWLGTGEEAATIGPVHALNRAGPGGDVVGPMIRNAGACHEMGMPVADMLRGYLATQDSPNRGRDLHIGGRQYGVVAPISVVGGLAPVMAGYGLAFRKLGVPRVALTWVGDGATKAGEVHEAFNFAAVQHLPVIFVIQNNQVALGTYLHEHHAGGDFRDWGRLYGAQSAGFDGNHVLDAYGATRWAVERCRAGEGPVILAAETFRMGGHATHDEAEARELFSAEMFAEWGRRDPIGCYEVWLAEAPIDLRTGERVAPGAAAEANRAALAAVEAEVTQEVESAAESALASRGNMPPAESAAEGVYGAWPDTDLGRAEFSS